MKFRIAYPRFRLPFIILWRKDYYHKLNDSYAEGYGDAEEYFRVTSPAPKPKPPKKARKK